ncbi:MAG: DEAD/DEAH box helicase family protein, partial [Firmicutes bacterium]|nr:DEAD/DEAH box helicase family protein [Bacillota bacterium]
SGKTRTVIALIDLLRQRGWIKNVLFLAERSSLVTQARRNFESMLPELEVADAGRDPENYGANCVFSTYQALASVIDTARDGQGRVFTCGHFDLVICDEVHRSVYYRYRDIFTYFDALLVGLSATPKDDIDEDIYKLFGLEKGAPTYAYGLSRAVGDGYLVDFMSVDTRVKFIEPGVAYDDLSEQERKTCEQLPAQGGAPDGSGLSAALREWLFNEDTIREALRVLREYGLKIAYGQELGKTIIFAQDHAHAEKILAVFGKEYPGAEGFAAVIDNDTPHVQRAIDAFADPRKLPRIAISADALDSGIDIPDVLNLVFFKKVTSKDRFWQMIGRGTRLCSELMDGKDKEKFYIFDFCGNFEFFRMDRKGAAESGPALAGVVFMLKAQIVRKLRELPHQTQELNEYWEKLTEHMARKVNELDRENFAVRQHLRSVETYAVAESYQTLTDEDIQTMGQEIAPLITAEGEDERALRFDALMYSLELAHLCGREKSSYLSDLRRMTESIAAVKDTPKIKAQDKLLRKILESSYAAEADIGGLERIRKNLRGLIKYVPLNKVGYETAAGEALKAEK